MRKTPSTGRRSWLRASALLAACALFATGATGAGADAGGASQAVVALTTADGSSVARSGLQVSSVGGPTVGSENLAAATSTTCTGCRTIAVAIQAVYATGDPSTVVPHNAAVASNAGCTSCTTYAYAYQYVLTTDGPVYLGAAGQATIATLRQAVTDAAASDLSLDALTARLDSLAAQFRAAIDQYVPAGQAGSGTATRQVDLSTAP